MMAKRKIPLPAKNRNRISNLKDVTERNPYVFPVFNILFCIDPLPSSGIVNSGRC
jgi:hypothetical protein